MELVASQQQQLTKPTNALGRLEKLSARLAGITGAMAPSLRPRTVIVCAGDHGVTLEGVSAYPSEVTKQMVYNFLAGGAAINVLARQFDVNVIVLDVGVSGELPAHPRLRARKVRHGTANLAQGPAMSRREAVAAIEAGIRVAQEEIAAGSHLLLTGDMGIGNTTPSAAIAAVFTGLPVSQVTGMGTGVGLEGWRRKCAVIESALALHLPDPQDPIDVLSKVGGLEIGAIAGVIIAGAAARVPVVIDGVISTAGATLAVALCPAAKSFIIAGHRGVEPGHTALLDYLDLTPVLNLDLALGEGTGAVLALPILEAAVTTLNEMATFEEAQVAQARSAELNWQTDVLVSED
ncbi:MAG: nicotinate-nucleotide--dimethylbenzimidazole phosphoribosyltransferase [Caldilineaceae bacterium]|nr:nicotinate-nucleotide--dimethylbenzimidazole phosphoribosyltransferase [Caldilineaceae bacterium]